MNRFRWRLCNGSNALPKRRKASRCRRYVFSDSNARAASDIASRINTGLLGQQVLVPTTCQAAISCIDHRPNHRAADEKRSRIRPLRDLWLQFTGLSRTGTFGVRRPARNYSNATPATSGVDGAKTKSAPNPIDILHTVQRTAPSSLLSIASGNPFCALSGLLESLPIGRFSSAGMNGCLIAVNLLLTARVFAIVFKSE